MAHAKLNLQITPEWVQSQAAREPAEGITSAGGLAGRMDSAVDSGAHDARKLSLARFVELSRRRMRLTVEALAQRADVDLATLLAIESGEDVVPEPRTIFQLARVLNVDPEPLMELAGLIAVKNSSVGEVATRFAARSEPMAVLTPEEEEALNWFVDQISKR